MTLRNGFQLVASSFLVIAIVAAFLMWVREAMDIEDGFLGFAGISELDQETIDELKVEVMVEPTMALISITAVPFSPICRGLPWPSFRSFSLSSR
ncbi:MAG: hypothetical protein NTV58_09470 [Deltaproteobacteria bacterium]|nr:hypothetical protein [Deltaproteobacteria bacterium]